MLLILWLLCCWWGLWIDDQYCLRWLICGLMCWAWPCGVGDKCNINVIKRDLVLITFDITFAIMGRKATVQSNSMYSLASSTIEGMGIGELRIINMPADLPFFRKYLSEIGKRTARKFTTRSVENKLHVMRIKYSNIYSKQVD